MHIFFLAKPFFFYGESISFENFFLDLDKPFMFKKRVEEKFCNQKKENILGLKLKKKNCLRTDKTKEIIVHFQYNVQYKQK